MLELLLCSMLTILPDYLYRRFAQGKRFGREITLFSVWYELRWGITLCLILTISLITTIFYFPPLDDGGELGVPHRHHHAGDERPRGGDLRRDQPGRRGRPAAVPARQLRPGGGGVDGAGPPRGARGRRVPCPRPARRSRGGDRACARQPAAGAGRVRHPRRAVPPQSRRHSRTRGRDRAGPGRGRAGGSHGGRGHARRDEGPARDRAARAARDRTRPSSTRRRSRSIARRSSPAPTASCSSSPCGPATSSTRCCGPPASSCRRPKVTGLLAGFGQIEAG
jgi:hypothetical protein